MKHMRIEMFIPPNPHLAYEALKADIIDEVGGLTESPAIGYWVNSADKTIVERVNVFLFFCEDTEDNRLWVETKARQYRELAQQECVLYVINSIDCNFIYEE